MKKDAKIYVAGHRGLVGSAIVRRLEAEGFTNLITATHDELDLTRQEQVEGFFHRERPDHVFLAAAKVGGIHANDTWPADFVFDNLTIQTNVLESARKTGVLRLLFLGSSCIYPRECPQPMKEEHLLTGPLEPTNRPYAVAKIAGIVSCEAYNRQHATRYLAAMPTNLYGPGDNFDLETSHVLPALIRKFHLAKYAAAGDEEGIRNDEAAFGPIPEDICESLSAIAVDNGHSGLFMSPAARQRPAGARSPGVLLWGTGTPAREFLYVDDLADACLFLMNLKGARFDALLNGKTEPGGTPYGENPMPLVNIGAGKDATIAELAEKVAAAVGYGGPVVWDREKPDGTPRKLLDVSRMSALGWHAETSLTDGIAATYRWYREISGSR